MTNNAVPPQGGSDHNQKMIEAEQIVRQYSLLAGAAGAIPIPVVDLAAVISLQVAMLKKIGTIYDQKFSDHIGKTVISSITSGYFANSAGNGAAKDFVKSIPGIGSIVSMVVVPALAASATWALGQVFILHFDSGGAVFNFNFDQAKNDFRTLKQNVFSKTPQVQG